MKKIVPILLTILIIYIGLSEKQFLLNLVDSDSELAIPISIFLVSLLVFFPVIPYVVLAGMIGSVFGIWLGSGISIVGIGLGMMLMFLFSRYGFQEWAQSYLKKYPKIQEYETMFEQHAFFSIVLSRMVPVIPSPVINILSGLSKVKWTVFLSASLIGKLPAIFLFTFAGSLLSQQKWVSILVYGVYFVLIGLLAGRQIQKNKLSQQGAQA
jgi:uncharacterized membrane protein YdjX (TVP38/TMEM64 family)